MRISAPLCLALSTHLKNSKNSINMKEEFLKTREGLKYLLKTFPSNMPVSIAIKKATNNL